ncbi:hypothetical protein [Yokenella regensburgei]|uniref:hypothetical protein n=1 Tax=Yokenella regensburgei TaxID=158877 RepID=UPI0009073D71|nr:hypothetical protein [Yokenella regensburgei]SQA68113.1 Uncharacterised protein [Yokenella regensburgei]SUQ06427.1 Uncharacterised protein [Yokenella regensburgei]
MKLQNGPVLCPHCGSMSAYCEIDRLCAIRARASEGEHPQEWASILTVHKKRAFCLTCHQSIVVSTTLP